MRTLRCRCDRCASEDVFPRSSCGTRLGRVSGTGKRLSEMWEDGPKRCCSGVVCAMGSRMICANCLYGVVPTTSENRGMLATYRGGREPLRSRICYLPSILKIHRLDCEYCAARRACGIAIRGRLADLNGRSQADNIGKEQQRLQPTRYSSSASAIFPKLQTISYVENSAILLIR